MKNISELAKQIIASSVTNLPAIKTDFSEIKRKTTQLEHSITTFSGDDDTWEKIENWKPLAEEIIKDFEDIMEKL